MKNLIIDAANEKIFFSIITEIQSYTTTHVNSRENFDKFINLLLDFLKKNKIKLDDVENIFINQGPGKFSSIRISISIAKAISIAKNISLFGFNSKDLDNGDYKKLLKLHKKDLLNKNLIKPLYLS
jgi:tRNA A37 threonylcarbamoyladenosine modification protein TsaB